MSRQSTISSSDEIWSIIKETQKNQKEFQKELETSQKEFQKELETSQKERIISQKEAPREIKELRIGQKELQISQKETAQQLKKFAAELLASQKELRISQKETDRQIQKIGGRFNERWGRLVESLVEGSLLELLQGRGIKVAQIFPNAEGRIEKEKGIFHKQEADIIAANGSEVVVVEVKTVLSPKKVNNFLESLQSFTRYFPGYKNKTLYGAVAYLKREDKADSFAEEKGLFVIRATGDSASIINQKDFKPKAFS